jgi:hypothetical protein
VSNVSLPSPGLLWPLRSPPWTVFGVSGTNSVSRSFTAALAMSAVTDDIHHVGYLEWSDGGSGKTIDQIVFVPATVTSPIGTVRAGLQPLASGVTTKRGDNTWHAYGTFDPSTLVVGTPKVVTVNTAVTAETFSHGELIAVSFQWDAYTSGSFDLRCWQRVADSTQMPAVARNTTGALVLPNILVRASDGTWGKIKDTSFGASDSLVEFVSGDAANEYGNRFISDATITVDGIWVRHSVTSETNNDFLIGIYTAAGTEVITREPTQAEYTADAGEYRWHRYNLAPTSLTANTAYVVAVRSRHVTNDVGLEKITYGSADYLEALPGGTSCYAVSRGGGTGAFDTVSTSQSFSIALNVSEIDDGIGGVVGGTGTEGTHVKALVHASAAGATGVDGVVFMPPSAGDICGDRIGEFTDASFEASLESGQAVIKIPVTSFGGTGLTDDQEPVILVRNVLHTTSIVPATVIIE